MENKNIRLLPVQMNVLKSTKPISGIYSSRSAGKTYCASILAAMALNNNERVLVLAQNYKSLSENIFCEIINRLEEFGIENKVNRSNLTISNSGRGRIMCGSYENLDALRGFTEISLLLLDEVAYSPANLLAVVAPCLRGKGIKPKIRFFSSPKMNSWFNRYLKDNNVEYFTATIYDNTFISDESRALMEASVTNEQMRQQELYGKILDGDIANAIVNIGDFPVKVNMSLPSTRYYIGVDCSGFGKDNNAIVIRNDQKVLSIYKVRVATSEQLASYIMGRINDMGYEPEYIAIDMAYGQALYEKLSERYTTYIVPFAGKSEEAEYFNKRSQMYLHLSKAIKDGFYVDDEDVKSNLSLTTFELKGDKILLTPKDELKDVIGHSPDVEDALALTFLFKHNTTEKEITSMSKEEEESYYDRWLGAGY